MKQIKDTTWAIDQTHCDIEFKVRHLMISHVKGTFKNFDANIHTDGKDFTTADIDLWIDASSISTGDAKRDLHLRSSDFLDVVNHKQITFISHTISKANKDGIHELWGELTILGVKQNIMLNVTFGGLMTDPWGNEKAGFSITGKLSRKDFGLVWNTSIETGGLLVSDEVSISCEFELSLAKKEDMKIKLEPFAIN